MSLAFNELKKGMALEIDDKPCILLEYSRSKKDRGAPVIKMRYKEIISGKVLTKTFSGYDIKIESAEIDRVAATFMYSDQDNYYFMNQSSFEQITLSIDILSDNIKFLVDQLKIDLLYYQNNPISIELPNSVEMKVVSTDNAVKGDTTQGATKKAILDTGLEINVPLFILNEDIVKVDTRTSEYLGRL